MKKFLIKYYKIMIIFLLTIALGVDVFFTIQYGIYAQGLFGYFYTSDVAAAYICRHLYAVSILFSISTLILLCLFNKIGEEIRFVSLYVSILHIVVYFILIIISLYVNEKILAFFANVVWLAVCFASIPIFIFTLVFALKNQEVLVQKEDKENLELF